MKASAWLVVRRGRNAWRIVRCTQRRAYVDVDEARIRLTLDLPDDLFDEPSVTVPVERYLAEVGVEVEEPEPEEAEA